MSFAALLSELAGVINASLQSLGTSGFGKAAACLGELAGEVEAGLLGGGLRDGGFRLYTLPLLQRHRLLPREHLARQGPAEDRTMPLKPGLWLVGSLKLSPSYPCVQISGSDKDFVLGGHANRVLRLMAQASSMARRCMCFAESL